jgi:hypothetical protein
MSAVRRNAAVDDYLGKLSTNIAELARALREVVFEAEPDIEEAVKWSRPVYSRNGLVCSIDVAKKHVNLGFFRGASLSDKAKLLEGTGKDHRHIKVRSLDDIKKDDFKALINEAVGLNLQ